MPSLTVNSTAGDLPVTLDEAMSHCRVTDSEESAYLTDLIAKATRYCEDYLQRRFINQDLRLSLDSFPGCETDEVIELPQPPYARLKSITYYNTAGTLTTLCNTATSTAVQIDSYSEPARIKPAYGTVWPATREQLNAVSIIYTAGYSTAPSGIPKSIKHGILLLVGHWYEYREPVNIGNIVTPIDYTIDSVLNAETYNRIYAKPC